MHVGDTLGGLVILAYVYRELSKVAFCEKKAIAVCITFSMFVLDLVVNIFDANVVLEFILYRLRVAFIVLTCRHGFGSTFVTTMKTLV